MTEREALIMLSSGYVERGADGWWAVLAHDERGIFSTWRPAEPGEAAGLDAALATYPAVAQLHENLMAQTQGHRANCEALRPNACSCRRSA